MPQVYFISRRFLCCWEHRTFLEAIFVEFSLLLHSTFLSSLVSRSLKVTTTNPTTYNLERTALHFVKLSTFGSLLRSNVLGSFFSISFLLDSCDSVTQSFHLFLLLYLLVPAFLCEGHAQSTSRGTLFPRFIAFVTALGNGSNRLAAELNYSRNLLICVQIELAFVVKFHFSDLIN